MNNMEILTILFDILEGPGLPMTQFSIQIIDMVLRMIRQLLKYSNEVKVLLVTNKKYFKCLVKIINMLDLSN